MILSNNTCHYSLKVHKTPPSNIFCFRTSPPFSLPLRGTGGGAKLNAPPGTITPENPRPDGKIDYGKRWPLFGFERHKGYGTRAHHDAIRAHGMVEIHRRSFLKKMEASGGKVNEFKG